MKTQTLESIGEEAVRVDSLVQEKLAYKELNFKTRRLVVNGEMNLKVSGFPEYADVSRVEISYHSPMEIDLTGRMIECGNAVETEKARLRISADRTNQAEKDLNATVKGVYIQPVVKDPDIVLYQKGNRVVLNQAQGAVLVNISRASIEYK